MEPMDGEQGLESSRSSIPELEGDQSSDINAEVPWTFPLQSNPEDNRDENPKLYVTFNKPVEVHALKLQGNSDQSQFVRIIPSVRDRSSQTFSDVLDSSGNPLVSAGKIQLCLQQICTLRTVHHLLTLSLTRRSPLLGHA